MMPRLVSDRIDKTAPVFFSFVTRLCEAGMGRGAGRRGGGERARGCERKVNVLVGVK